MVSNYRNVTSPMTPLWNQKNTQKNNYLFMMAVWKGFLTFEEAKAVVKRFAVCYVAAVVVKT
jgi:hypothetical protein